MNNWNINPQSHEEEFVPKSWTPMIDKNGMRYYVNTQTGQIRSKPPIYIQCVKQWVTVCKTFIFIEDGYSIRGYCTCNPNRRKRKWIAMAAGIVSKSSDPRCRDCILMPRGINETYKLSCFLRRHFRLHQFQSLISCYNSKHESIAIPIENALHIIQSEILDKYCNELQEISGDLENKCKEMRDILEKTYKTIQINHNSSFQGIDDETKEHKMNNYDLEIPLDIEQIVYEMIDSSNNSIVVTSHLRRTINTAIIALWDRFDLNANECIHILPYLQQVHRLHFSDHIINNFTPLSTANIADIPSEFERFAEWQELDGNKMKEFLSSRLINEQTIYMEYRKQLILSGYIRKMEQLLLFNVPIDVTSILYIFYEESLEIYDENTRQRLDFFCNWAFRKNDENGNPYNTIITCGDGGWFKQFFANYLPLNTQSIATETYLERCGVVGFKMICYIGNNQRRYGIIPQSITPIYKGFQLNI